MPNTLRINEQDYRTLHELQSLLARHWEGVCRQPGGSVDMEPHGLFAMVEGRWSEATAADRHRLGSTLATIGKSPAGLLSSLYNCLLGAARSPDVEPQLLLLVKAAFVDLQVVLDGYAKASQANLRQALEMALNAKIDLQQLTRVASHDLKTPLATVANLCDEVLDEFGDEIPTPARKLIGAARNRVFETSRTIDELLEGAAQHHIVDTNRRLSLESVLAEAAQRLRQRFPQRALMVESPAHLPNVYGDPLRLREALLQVFAIAVLSGDQPIAEIQITAEVGEGVCVVRINSDTLAVFADQAEECFYPFFQSRYAADGSGLALYFARLLIEQQGGRLWAEVRDGHSLELLLSLPMICTKD